MEATGETFETNAAKDLLIKREIIQAMAGMFLGEGGNPQDTLANPLRADLKGLPPMYIQVGADETLLDDSGKLAISGASPGGCDAGDHARNAARLPVPGRQRARSGCCDQSPRRLGPTGTRARLTW
jgi:acetyl esterase/lipase